jgi:hypothetical protein
MQVVSLEEDDLSPCESVAAALARANKAPAAARTQLLRADLDAMELSESEPSARQHYIGALREIVQRARTCTRGLHTAKHAPVRRYPELWARRVGQHMTLPLHSLSMAIAPKPSRCCSSASKRCLTSASNATVVARAEAACARNSAVCSTCTRRATLTGPSCPISARRGTRSPRRSSPTVAWPCSDRLRPTRSSLRSTHGLRLTTGGRCAPRLNPNFAMGRWANCRFDRGLTGGSTIYCASSRHVPQRPTMLTERAV